MITTIVGKRGRGKTSLAIELIQKSKASKVYIKDYLGDYLALQSKKILDFPYNIEESAIWEFCNFVWEESKKNKSTLVVFDEIERYGKDNDCIKYLYDYGRHTDMELIAISRRIMDLPVIVRSQTDRYSIFQTIENRDLDHLRRYCDENLIQRIIHLNFYEYINIDF